MKKLLSDAGTIICALLVVWALSITAFSKSVETQAEEPPECWDCIWQIGYCNPSFFGYEGCVEIGFDCFAQGDWCDDIWP